MEFLPFIVQEQIYKLLSVRELLICSSICKQWKKLINEGELSERVWHAISDVKFGCKRHSKNTWRLAFKTNTIEMKKLRKRSTRELFGWVTRNGHAVILREIWKDRQCREEQKLIKNAIDYQHLHMILELETPIHPRVLTSGIRKAPLPVFLTVLQMIHFDVSANLSLLIEGAITAKNQEVLSHLLPQAKEEDISSKCIMFHAITTNNLGILNEIKNTYKRVGGDRMWQEALGHKTSDYKNLLIFAASISHEVSVKFLLENGADVNYEAIWWSNAIHACCFHPTPTTPKIIDLLLQHGASIDTPLFNPAARIRKTCLHTAVKSGSVELVKHLLSKGVDFSNEEFAQSVMFEAKSTEMITTLLDQGIDPLLAPQKRSLLEHFISSASFEKESKAHVLTLFERLRAAGVKPYFFPSRHCTSGIPLYVLKWLVVHGKMDINSRNSKGNTLLIMACKLRNFGAWTSYLLHKGADPNATNNNGFSALHYAINVHYFPYDSARKLLAAGAKPSPEYKNHPIFEL